MTAVLRRIAGRVRHALVALLVAPVRFYRYAISPMLAPSCRFVPTCSEYAIESLRRHGPLRGSWLTASRVCRCNPWNEGGVDPVPPDPAPRTTPLARASARWPAALCGDPPARTD